jgi:hypothetical protein
MNTSSFDLTLSIISTDNLKLLLPCLRSVFQNTHAIDLEVYVVDNASQEDLVGAVQQEFPQVTIIRNEQKLGFSTNNNLVLERGKGRYLMLLNDDTLVLDGALNRMVAFMESHPEAGVVGSALLNPDHSSQPSFALFPRPLVEAIWPSTNWSHYLIQHKDRPFEADSVCGAALLVRREVLEQVGPLDTDFDPIYSEEVEWCYRIKKTGWKIYSLPDANIIHYGSYTMNRAVPRKYELLLSHKARYFRKHSGLYAVRLYKTALYLATMVKFLWWSLISLTRPHDMVCTEKVKLHRHLLKRISSF